jgi:type IV secretion system protein VirB1
MDFALTDFDALASQCAPAVAVSTLRAMATVESGMNPFAIGVVGGALKRQPRSLGEGVSTVNDLIRNNVQFSAGLIQIYVRNWKHHEINAEAVFDPCQNMRASQAILMNCYLRASKVSESSQHALRKAVSCYYSNNFSTGFRHGYVQKVVAMALKFERARSDQPRASSAQPT